MRKLGRKKSNREHMIRNLATSLILYETLDTTEAKAKDVKSYTEKMIAHNKKGDLDSYKDVISKVFDKNAAKKLTEELLPRYEGKNSGFIRSYKLKNRLGDNASMMRLELSLKKVFIEKKKDKEAPVKEIKKNEKK
jgi:large subunit ribosomal protein L17